MKGFKELIRNSQSGLIVLLMVVLATGLEMAGLYELDGLFGQIVHTIEIILAAIGVRDLLTEKKKGFVALITEWRSKTFLGFVISGLAGLLINQDFLAQVPPGLLDELEFFAKLFGTFGFFDAHQKGKFGNGIK